MLPKSQGEKMTELGESFHPISWRSSTLSGPRPRKAILAEEERHLKLLQDYKGEPRSEVSTSEGQRGNLRTGEKFDLSKKRKKRADKDEHTFIGRGISTRAQLLFRAPVRLLHRYPDPLSSAVDRTPASSRESTSAYPGIYDRKNPLLSPASVGVDLFPFYP